MLVLLVLGELLLDPVESEVVMSTIIAGFAGDVDKAVSRLPLLLVFILVEVAGKAFFLVFLTNTWAVYMIKSE